jgi:hypothetical protein
MALLRIVSLAFLLAACASQNKRVFNEGEHLRDAYLREAEASGAKINSPLDVWAYAPNAFIERVNPPSKPQSLLNFLAPIELKLIKTPNGRGPWWLDLAYQMSRDQIQSRSAKLDTVGDCLKTYLQTLQGTVASSLHEGCARLAEHHQRQLTDFDRKSLVAAIDGYGQLLPQRLTWVAQQEALKIDQSYRMSLEKSRAP